VHHIHTTYGLVIQSRPHGEANKIIYILTRDFGLITAIAQGIRYERSKLRYKVQDYNFANFSLVKGKEFWRLVGADEIFSVENESGKLSSIKHQILCKVSALLMRLVHGEEKSEQIYDCIWNFYNFNFESYSNNQDYIGTIESLLVLRILYWLGYVSHNVDFVDLLKKVDFDESIVRILVEKRTIMNKSINSALRESHL
jgi:DNA repair protein RecO